MRFDSMLQKAKQDLGIRRGLQLDRRFGSEQGRTEVGIVVDLSIVSNREFVLRHGLLSVIAQVQDRQTSMTKRNICIGRQTRGLVVQNHKQLAD